MDSKNQCNQNSLIKKVTKISPLLMFSLLLSLVCAIYSYFVGYGEEGTTVLLASKFLSLPFLFASLFLRQNYLYRFSTLIGMVLAGVTIGGYSAFADKIFPGATISALVATFFLLVVTAITSKKKLSQSLCDLPEPMEVLVLFSMGTTGLWYTLSNLNIVPPPPVNVDHFTITAPLFSVLVAITIMIFCLNAKLSKKPLPKKGMRPSS